MGPLVSPAIRIESLHAAPLAGVQMRLGISFELGFFLGLGQIGTRGESGLLGQPACAFLFPALPLLLDCGQPIEGVVTKTLTDRIGALSIQ